MMYAKKKILKIHFLVPKIGENTLTGYTLGAGYTLAPNVYMYVYPAVILKIEGYLTYVK